MADITLDVVDTYRAQGSFDLEVGTSTTVEAPIPFPVENPLVAAELDLGIFGGNEFATDWYISDVDQNENTGYITITLNNATAAAPGDMGRFTVTMTRVRL